MLLPSKYDPLKKVKPLNLAELFAKFSATVTRLNDQPGYMGVEENKVNEHYANELQLNNEKGSHYNYNHE